MTSFAFVTVATAYADMADDEVEQVFDFSFKESLSKYSELFGMKEECAGTFIGMTMVIDEEQMVQSWVEPNLNLGSTTMPAAKIQNRYTGASTQQRMAIMIGMLFRAIDCATMRSLQREA